MKHIVLFGAGKSATVLIEYLKSLATEKNWEVTVADADLGTIVEKVGMHELVKPHRIDVADQTARKALVNKADLVISLLPPFLHYSLALDCIEFGKHLLTASYVDDNIRSLQQQISEKKLLFLCEMGLDPGIDHMSAMQVSAYY